MIAVVMLGTVTTVLHTTPVYCRLACSAQEFRQRFHDLERSRQPLSTIERIVLSLLLASDDAADAGGRVVTSS